MELQRCGTLSLYAKAKLMGKPLALTNHQSASKILSILFPRRSSAGT